MYCMKYRVKYKERQHAIMSICDMYSIKVILIWFVRHKFFREKSLSRVVVPETFETWNSG